MRRRGVVSLELVYEGSDRPKMTRGKWCSEMKEERYGDAGRP